MGTANCGLHATKERKKERKKERNKTIPDAIRSMGLLQQLVLRILFEKCRKNPFTRFK
jgi:hypothetical protein